MTVGINNKRLYLAIIACNLAFLIVALLMLLFIPQNIIYSSIHYAYTKFDVLIAPIYLIIFSTVAILISRNIPIKDPEIKESSQRVILYSLVVIAFIIAITLGNIVEIPIIFICICLGIIGTIACMDKNLDSDDKKWRRWNYGLTLILFSILLLILNIFIIPDEFVYSSLFLMMIIYEIEIITYEIKID